MISRRVQKRLDMEQFHHFGTVFVKEDGEMGKIVLKPCLFFVTKSQHATRQWQHLRLSRPRVTESHDKNCMCDISLNMQ